ncbi:MAG: DNA-binding protein [Olpidium bornovanus]|uniref:DNA-binding protein n=1 Tax=Olpidium bornovanus TaxID=278681 RepID=A0A8H7ZN84_9FUNG|nr:MAG: DNA-binding protein [Olpidium bornovanus]
MRSTGKKKKTLSGAFVREQDLPYPHTLAAPGESRTRTRTLAAAAASLSFFFFFFFFFLYAGRVIPFPGFFFPHPGPESILFQRGVYPADDFRIAKAYGTNVLVTTDENLIAYLRRLCTHLESTRWRGDVAPPPPAPTPSPVAVGPVERGCSKSKASSSTQRSQWVLAGKITKMVMVIKSRDTCEPVERWQFDIQREDGDSESREDKKGRGPKTEKEIQAEIGQLMRQITSCVTFLPSSKSNCTFNVLVYAEKDVEVSADWADSEPHVLKNCQQVKLRSFSTSVHKVEGMVAYVPESE